MRYMSTGERRVKLKHGEQRKLFLSLAIKFGSVRRVATEWKIPYSTLKNYSLEERYMPEFLFDKILKSLSLEKNNFEIYYLDANWGRRKGSRLGMAVLKNKYPDKLLEWRRAGIRKAIETGKHYGYANMHFIKRPELDERLAEFIGVYLGDGTLNEYQIRIAGDYRYDLRYFKYISSLIFDLFGIVPSIRKEKKGNGVLLIVYSKNLCSYLKEKFSLNYGGKIRNKNVI